ncbi:MAG: hypothetical protein ACRC62_12655 [Microcoleus sp.]
MNNRFAIYQTFFVLFQLPANVLPTIASMELKPEANFSQAAFILGSLRYNRSI